MFNFDIVLSKKSNSRKVILHQPLLFYIVFLIISLTIFSSIIFYTYSIVSLILLVITLSILTYREEWVFDGDRKVLEIINGLGFIYPRKVYGFAEIELLEYIIFTKGSKLENKNKISKMLQKKIHTIKIYYLNGERDTILTVTDKHIDKISIILEEIARVTKVKVERPL